MSLQHLLELLLFEKKSHRTNDEIQERIDSEIRLGTSDLKCPAFVRSDKVAYRRWKELIVLFDGFSFVSSSDIGHMARCCCAYSEYQDLIARRRAIADMGGFDPQEESAILDEFEEKLGAKQAKKMWEKVNFILSSAGVQSLDKSINSKMSALQAAEDRLFLNPLAKIKSVPIKKAEPKQEDSAENQMFGDG